MSKKINWPVDVATAAKMLNRNRRTVTAWCQRLKIKHLNESNKLTAFKIYEEDFIKLKNSMENARPGNPNLRKKK